MNGNNGAMQPPETPGGSHRPPTTKLGGRRRLAMIGVAGESVGVLAGAAAWRVSGEPAWILMAVVSFALALIMLRHI
ncbi:MAG TPA: hypothetical protein VNM48_21255 [Chloroflexota bacterium]|nr:hypothetical protein [Chloroflexota bacterium]